MKKRILFVDDEPNILSSMRRMLRCLRKTAEMDFVESGREALEHLAVQPYHVVVSDMQMPGMNGTELLTKVKELYPETVRVMLTGQVDGDAKESTSGVVDRFLNKPCEQDEIKEVLLRACGKE